MIIVAFLTILFGMIDLGIGVFRYNMVSHAARQGARLAIVHGSLATSGWQGGPWGPGTVGPVALSDSSAPAAAVGATVVGLDKTQAQMTITWLDGKNEADNRVRVTVTYPYRPFVTFIFGSPTYTLTATSTMIIAH